MDRRISAREIIREVARNMRESLERLEYKTLAPDHYDVYLEPSDYRDLEPLFPEIEQEVARKLDEELARLNEAAQDEPGWKLPWRRAQPAPTAVVRRGDRWTITFCLDEGPNVAPGDLAVDSYFSKGADGARMAGSRTQRIGAADAVGTATAGRAPAPANGQTTARATTTARPLARIRYADERGEHVFEMEKPAIVIGRADPAAAGYYWTDLQLHTKPDVSRTHARIRFDAATGAFEVKDVSRFGTTIDGAPVPPSMQAAEGERRDRDVWVPLPPRCRIGLAGVVTLQFEAASDRSDP